MNCYKPWVVVAVILTVFCSFCTSSIIIEKNAYKGISVSFSKRVHEENFKKLKVILVRSSELLYHATRRRSYFGEFVISLPHTLGDDLCESTSESPSKVDIHLDDWTDNYSTLTTKHSGGCGTEGDIIYMPVQWLKGDTEDLARQFVKQWSIYRYGVFEEEPVSDETCFMSQNNWTPVGCYNVKVNVEAIVKNGVPVCSLPADFFMNNQLKSSLMSQSNSSEILNFCDGSEDYPHNPSLPTLHNNLCEGKTVWSVIEDSDDFKYGRNFALKKEQPPSEPVFKCFKEQQIRVTFAIQSNTVKKDLSYDMVELGYSLYQFLGNVVPSETKANIVMFSDNEDNSTSVDLNLKNLKELETTITKTVTTYKPVQNTCLSCGLQKALEASSEHTHPSPIVILIAWESSLTDENLSQLTESVRKFLPNVRLHLILVEDTDTEEVVPSSLVEAVRTTGGNIFFLPQEHVFMAAKLQVILAGVVRNQLQVEDSVIVVHESTYNNITSSFVDSFSIPGNMATGKLMYNMYCDWSKVEEQNTNCTKGKTASSTFKCGEVSNINDPLISMRTWKYPFEYSGTILPNCSSVAIFQLSTSSKKASTLRGWLNKHQIYIGRDALIIYAEIARSSNQRIEVFATVSSAALKSPIRIELLDNGNGDPDVKLGDGIYSRYFSSFTKKGIYVVTISAEVFNTIDKSLLAKANEKVPGLVQKKIIGSFSVNQDAPDVDIFPPNRIADLRVISIDHENSSVTLQWTAPGDDYDLGKATSYEIKYSAHSASLSELYFNDDENTLLPTNSCIPSDSGGTEKLEFYFSEIKSGSPYYVALRAIDKSKNKGRISNIVQVYFNQSHGIVTETSTNPDEISSLGSTVPSIEPENGNHTTNSTTQTPTESTTSENETTVNTPQPENDEFFDKKFIIVISSAGGILIVIIILNIVICCCCIKKEKPPPETRILSKKTSLRPPYNLNIAYQEDSNSSQQTDNEGVSMSTLDRNIYTEPGARNRTSHQRLTYHTDKSLQNKVNSQADSELGFKVVQTLPPYATSSLSRFRAKLNDLDSETDTDTDLPTRRPRKPSDFDDAQLYPLATTYEVYFTEDWKDLEESMLTKLTPRILDSPYINTPKPSGEKEEGIFLLPTENSKIKVYYIAVRGIDKSQNRGTISNIIQVVIGLQEGQFEITTNENVTGNGTETSTDSNDKANLGMGDFSNCYVILGGCAAVILLILIINVLIWGICCRRYKKRESPNIVSEGSKDLELEDNTLKDNTVHHSYTNPIMEGYNNSERNGLQSGTGRLDPSVEYAVVVKRDKRNQDPRRTRQFGRPDNAKQSERDLGLV